MDCKRGTTAITIQIATLLDQIDKSVYTLSIPLFHGATIGQHIRHILEFYTCLIDGAPKEMVDYNTRKRNLEISEQIEIAKTVLEYIDASVGKLNEQQGLQVFNEFGNNLNDDRIKYNSSIGRELQYAFDHAIHHLAIIRMGIETMFPHIQLDPQLGIAPSTLKYHFEEYEVVVPATTQQ